MGDQRRTDKCAMLASLVPEIPGPVWTALRAAAVDLARHGRPVLPAVEAQLPLPPIARDGLPYRWQVHPTDVGWVVPASAAAQPVLAASLSGPASGARPSLT